MPAKQSRVQTADEYINASTPQEGATQPAIDADALIRQGIIASRNLESLPEFTPVDAPPVPQFMNGSKFGQVMASLASAFNPNYASEALKERERLQNMKTSIELTNQRARIEDFQARSADNARRTDALLQLAKLKVGEEGSQADRAFQYLRENPIDPSEFGKAEQEFLKEAFGVGGGAATKMNQTAWETHKLRQEAAELGIEEGKVRVEGQKLSNKAQSIANDYLDERMRLEVENLAAQTDGQIILNMLNDLKANTLSIQNEFERRSQQAALDLVVSEIAKNNAAVRTALAQARDVESAAELRGAQVQEIGTGVAAPQDQAAQAVFAGLDAVRLDPANATEQIPVLSDQMNDINRDLERMAVEAEGLGNKGMAEGFRRRITNNKAAFASRLPGGMLSSAVEYTGPKTTTDRKRRVLQLQRSPEPITDAEIDEIITMAAEDGVSFEKIIGSRAAFETARTDINARPVAEFKAVREASKPLENLVRDRGLRERVVNRARQLRNEPSATQVSDGITLTPEEMTTLGEFLGSVDAYSILGGIR